MKQARLVLLSLYGAVALSVIAYYIGAFIFVRAALPIHRVANSPVATSTVYRDTLSVNQLLNGYIFDGASVIRLANGRFYTGISCVADTGTTLERVTMFDSDYCTINDDTYEASGITLDTTTVAYGDFNQDSKGDMVVQLYSSGGGSGTFYDVELFLNQDGMPVPVTIIRLGDREPVDSMHIEHNLIDITHAYHLSDDPACCPSGVEHLVYQWKAGKLTLKSRTTAKRDAYTSTSMHLARCHSTSFI